MVGVKLRTVCGHDSLFHQFLTDNHLTYININSTAYCQVSVGRSFQQVIIADVHLPSTTMSANQTKQTALPQLPHNVLIFTPTESSSASALLKGRIFTKLVTTTRTTTDQLQSAVEKLGPKENRESFCLPFRKGILIFDGATPEMEQEELTDVHHEHFRQVCLALKDSDINLDFSACIFDADDVLKAGFQLDAMSKGAVLVIDLMDTGDEESDSDSDENEDDATTEANLNALVGGNTVEAQ